MAVPSYSQSHYSSAPSRLEFIPLEELASYDWYVSQQDFGQSSGRLTESQITRRIARVYNYQSQMLVAQANGNPSLALDILRSALDEVEILREQPSIADNKRFQELYRTIVTEHDAYMAGPVETEYRELFALRANFYAEYEPVEVKPASSAPTITKPAVLPSIPMPEHFAVANARTFLLTKRRDHLIRWLSRMDTYFPLIESILAEEGVPDELKYLSVIESGLQPTVRSRAKAVGLWQFISATGRAYGLENNSWYDERMDPVKATRASAKHLKDLYKQYSKNWHVALAGYNCSPRCINRAIRANGGRVDFWGMYRHLNSETKGYVPMFIAAAQILSNPAKFGLPASVDGPDFSYDIVPVRGMLTFETIAKMVGVSESDIQFLNPELRRNSLPPGTGVYPLRIPMGTSPRFVEAFADLRPSDKPTIVEHTVSRGQSLGSIANRYGVSVSDIKSANNLRRNTIYPNQRLTIPTVNGTGGDAELIAANIQRNIEWGDPSRQPIQLDFEPSAPSSTGRSGVNLASTRSTSSSQSTSQSRSSANYTTHTVRRGDTLNKLAESYGTTVRSIQQINNLRGTRIQLGQRLEINATRQPSSSSGSTFYYTVRRGDTLDGIASRHGTTRSSIQRLNEMGRKTRIYPGQRLKISSTQLTHTVRRGDNLTKIAEKYGTTVSKIRSSNRINRRGTIQPGQKLTIPLR